MFKKKTEPPPPFEPAPEAVEPPPEPKEEFVVTDTGEHRSTPAAFVPAPGEQKDPALAHDPPNPLPGIPETQGLPSTQVRVEDVPAGDGLSNHAVFKVPDPIILEVKAGDRVEKHELTPKLEERAQAFYAAYAAEEYRLSMLASPPWSGLDENKKNPFRVGLLALDHDIKP